MRNGSSGFAEERIDIGRHSFLTKGKNWLDLSNFGECNSYDSFRKLLKPFCPLRLKLIFSEIKEACQTPQN